MNPIRFAFATMIMAVITVSCSAAAALDMRGDTIYMIMVDRFYDGDPTNNTAVNPYQYSPDHSEWAKYFGGDLEGIRQKLDYIKTIGATAVWVTPVCQNDPYLLSGGTPYHGYDMMDLYRVEPHFGNWSAFDAVADGLHSRGMKVILDTNINNAGYTGSGNLCRVYKDGLLKSDYNYDWQNWFHHAGSIPDGMWDDPYWMVNGNIFGMADLNQDNPAVRRYLLSAVSKWMWHGVDGFRLDAAKHVPVSFMRQFTDEMNKISGWLGRSGIYAFAEFYGGGANNPWSVDWCRQANTAQFDFQLASDIRNIELENTSFWDLWNTLQFRQTGYGTDSQGGPNSNWQVIWFDSQDWQRLITVLLQKYGGNETAARNRIDQSIVLLETLPGIPCIYYGTEQYLHNDSPGTGGVPGADPYNRPMMQSWDTNTNAARTLAALSGLRKRNTALQFGDIQQRYVTSSIFVYSRQWENSAVVVALNNSGVSQDIDASSLPMPDGSYEDVLHPGSWISVNNGNAHFSLPPTSSIVLARGTSAAAPALVSGGDSEIATQTKEIATQVTTAVPSIISAQSAITFDGRNIPSDFAGRLAATQDNFTWFGDSGNPGGGSELDQLFVANDASSLQLGITGNLETNGNCWMVFLETAPDGVSTLTTTAGPPSGVLAALSGTMMHENFSPNWLLVMNTYGGRLYIDLVDLVSNTTRYLGSVEVNSGSGILTGGDNPHGVKAAFDNTNTAGITSDASRSIAQTQTDAATAATGAELLLPFADIKLSTGKPKIMVLLVGSSGYISNQSLPGFGGKYYNPGNPPMDFDRIPAPQYAQVQLTGLSFPAEASPADTKALPDSTAVSLANLVVTGSYYPFSCYYIEDVNGTGGIRVRDTSGVLPVQGKLVTVQGFMTTHLGERIINAYSTTPGINGQMPPSRGLLGKAIGGKSAIPGASGANNLGLLVTAWGRVTDRGTDGYGNNYFYIDDGSGVWDGSYKSDGQKRLGVKATLNYTYPETGSLVRVTGVSTVDLMNGSPQRWILPRQASDVKLLAPAQ